MDTCMRTATGRSDHWAAAPRLGAIAFAVLIPVVAMAGTTSTDPVAPSQGVMAQSAPLVRPHAPRPAQPPLDRRMDLLTAELKLKPEQQIQIRALLQRQQEEVRRLWSDSTVPPPLRVGGTQAIGDRTGDAIRSVLDEEQRAKYHQPRHRDASVGAGGDGVEAWMSQRASH